MRQVPDDTDNWYRARMFWTYNKNSWDPAWYHKIGLPYRSSDEWGRRTIVWGVGFLGYICFAYRTCWCQSCHTSREQTYRLEVERWQDHQKKVAAGQCTCENLIVYKTRSEGGKVAGICDDCRHPLQGHDEWGECTYVDVSIRPIGEAPPEILKIGS